MYKVMEKSKRMLAFLLSAVMVLSTVEGSVLTAFAAEENEVAVSEATVNEVQTAEVDAQSVSGGDVSGDEGGEENTYAGTEFTDNWGEGDFYGFEINAWEMDENADFEAEALSILTGLEKTYDIVSISFRSLADAVSKDLWNAAVAATDSANKDYEMIRINFGSGSEAPNENWCFNDVTAISDENITSVNLGITVAFSETSGGGATIHTDENLSNLSSIAGCANVNISADSEGRAEAFNAMQTAFGTESMDLEVADNNGDIVSGGYFNCNYQEENSYLDVGVNDLQSLSAGTTYTISQKVYRGDVNTWMEGEYEFEELYLDPGMIGENSFTVEKITELLGNYAEKAFDQIVICYITETMGGTVDKDVINAALPYLKDSTEDRAGAVRISFRNSATDSSNEWQIRNPGEQTADQELVASLTVSGENVYISAESQTLAADSISLDFRRNKEKDADTVSVLEGIFGEGFVDLEVVDTECYANADSDDWNWWLSVNDIQLLEAGGRYQVIKSVYKGDVHTWMEEDYEFEELYLDPGMIGENSFTVEKITELLGNYAEKAFDQIVICYITETMGGTVDKDVINAALPYLKDSTEDRAGAVRISFRNSATGSANEWQLDNPGEQAEDQELVASLTVSGENVYISVESQTLVADSISLDFMRDKERDADTVSALEGIFGEGFVDLEVVDTECHANADSDDWNWRLSVNDIQLLEAGESYQVIRPVYVGNVEESEETRSLRLDYHDAGVDFLDETAILNLLAIYSQAGDTFDSIEIVNPEPETIVIDKDIVDAAAPLVRKTEGRENALAFRFDNEETQMSKAWVLINPVAGQEADATVSSAISISEEGQVEVKISENTFSAEKYQVIFGVRAENESSESLRSIFDFPDFSWNLLAIGDGVADGAWIPSPDAADLVIYLNEDTVWSEEQWYEVAIPPYTGDVNTWMEDDYERTELRLDPQRVDKESFTADEIADILSSHEEKSFDEIVIMYASAELSGTVDEAVMNAALPYLKDSTEDRPSILRLSFTDFSDSQNSIDWMLVNPQEQTEDQDLSASLVVSDGEVTVSVGSQSLNADRVNLNFNINKDMDADTVSDLEEIFGEGRVELTVADTECRACVDSDEWFLWISIDDINQLEAESTYQLIKYQYKGRVETWDDGTKELNISFWENGEEAFSSDELLALLDNYSAEDELGSIYINQPWTDNNVIAKAVADKAASIVQEGGSVKFAFTNPHTDQFMEWNLHGVTTDTAQTGDQSVNANLIMGETDNCVYLSVKEQSLVAEDVTLLIGTSRMNENEEADTFITDIYGMNEKDIQTEGEEIDGWYIVDDWNVIFEFRNPGALEEDVLYKIVDKPYRGEVWEFEENGEMMSELYVNADRFGKETLTAEDFATIAEYYESKEMKFDRITLEQRYTDNNVIKKEIINTARELFVNPEWSPLTYKFSRTVWEERDEEGNIIQEELRDEMVWEISAPGVATEDIDANIILEAKGGAGLSVETANNDYDVANINVRFAMDPEAALYTDVLRPLYGEPLFDGDPNIGGPLCYLEEGQYYNKKLGAFYYKDNYDGLINLYMCGVQDWKGETDNRLVKCDYTDITMPVGTSVELETAHVADSGTLTWTALTPYDVTVNASYNGTKGLVTATRPDKDAYVMASYQSGGKDYIEVTVLHTTINVQGIDFEEDSFTVEWDGFLIFDDLFKINLKPAYIQHNISWHDLNWSIKGTSVALHESEYIYWDEELGEEVVTKRPNGGYTLVGYGTTEITVEFMGYTDTCTITVIEPAKFPEIPAIYAMPGVEEKLSDIDINAIFVENSANGDIGGTIQWEDPDTLLAPFADMDSHRFGVVYKPADGRKPIYRSLAVEMIHVQELPILAAVKDGEDVRVSLLNDYVMKVGEDVVIGYDMSTNVPLEVLSKYITNGDIKVQWTTKEVLTPETDEAYDFSMGTPQKYTASQKGKKVFTVSVINAKTGKTISSASATVNVYQNEVFTFDAPDFMAEDTVNSQDAMKGTYNFSVSAANYETAKKLTVKSADTSVLKIDKVTITEVPDSEEPVTIKVDYTFKKFGKTAITVTAADEKKISAAFACERVDYTPKVLQNSFTIDKAWMMTNGYSCLCTIAYQEDTVSRDTIVIKEELYRNTFAVEDGYLVLKDAGLKTGTHKITLQIPYHVNGMDEADVKWEEIAIKVKVTDSKPKASVKQTKKVNEFYKLSADSADGNGLLTINPGKFVLAGAHIEGDSIFTLTRIDTTNEYILSLKEGVDLAGQAITKEQKKIKVAYTLMKDSAICSKTVDVTVKTENKAPGLVLSEKSTTLYPNIGYLDTGFEILNKTTKESLVLGAEDISLVLDKKNNVVKTFAELEETDETVKVGKNNYTLYRFGGDAGVGIFLIERDCVKATDKFVIRVQFENWNKPVEVTYSVKVDVKIPKIKLGSKTITLNVHDDVYRYQTGSTKVSVTDFKNVPLYEDVQVVGANEASTKALQNNLSFYYNDYEGSLKVSVVNKGSEQDGTLLSGTYKFKVQTYINDRQISADLTVKTVSKGPDKAVKITKKGTIDVLRRDTTQITLNPKFSNLSGILVDFGIEGPDADMFDAYYDYENGNCVIKAKSEYTEDGTQIYNYSTKNTYKITPVYVLADQEIYEVKGAQQSIKVTQGKPKVTITSATSVLYADKGENMHLNFTAMVKDEEVFIKNVYLLNYTNDLTFDYESGELSVNDEMDEIKKASGKYKLKFAVVYGDKAGNEKVTQVTHTVTVVR